MNPTWKIGAPLAGKICDITIHPEVVSQLPQCPPAGLDVEAPFSRQTPPPLWAAPPGISANIFNRTAPVEVLTTAGREKTVSPKGNPAFQCGKKDSDSSDLDLYAPGYNPLASKVRVFLRHNLNELDP